MIEVTTIGIDIAKSVFQLHGINAAGEVVIAKRLTRGKVLAFFEKLPACLVGIEFQALEITNSCSNPFLQIWGRNGIKPLYDNRDDLRIMTGVAEKLAELLDGKRLPGSARSAHRVFRTTGARRGAWTACPCCEWLSPWPQRCRVRSLMPTGEPAAIQYRGPDP